MTFQALIALHRRAIRNPQPVPIPVDHRNRAPEQRQRQIYTDFASI